MKSFTYTIKDELGIHARPAGMLVKEAKNHESKITINMEGKTAECRKLIAIMGMAIKCGNTVEVQVEGPNEEKTYEDMQAFFTANL